MADVSVLIRVRGIVQGVGFRYFVAREASRLEISGQVRNLPDGSVEAVVVGEQASVTILIEKIRSGPAHANVESVDVTPIEPKGYGKDFRVI